MGARGEAAAARYLKRLGYRILVRGDRVRLGEIDLVALDGRTIVFVEVKTRESADSGHPAEAVDSGKQRRLTRLALSFLKRHRLLEYPARFDIVAVTWPAGAAAADRTLRARVRGSRTVATALVAWGQGVISLSRWRRALMDALTPNCPKTVESLFRPWCSVVQLRSEFVQASSGSLRVILVSTQRGWGGGEEQLRLLVRGLAIEATMPWCRLGATGRWPIG